MSDQSIAEYRDQVVAVAVRQANPRYYVGIQTIARGADYVIFRSRTLPTYESHGHEYIACGGPFRNRAECEGWINVQRRGWA